MSWTSDLKVRCFIRLELSAGDSVSPPFDVEQHRAALSDGFTRGGVQPCAERARRSFSPDTSQDLTFIMVKGR